jgi:hypothetical protein
VPSTVKKGEGDKQMSETGKRLIGSFSKWKDFTRFRIFSIWKDFTLFGEVEVLRTVEKDKGDKQMPETGKRLFGFFSMWEDFVRFLRS